MLPGQQRWCLLVLPTRVPRGPQYQYPTTK